MRKSISSLLLFVLSLASFAEEQFIVKDGESNAQIVITAENRPRMVSLAALELQYFIQKMSGARLPIVTSADTSAPLKIYVGKSPETDKLGIKTDDLKYGAFKIVSGDEYLVLIGKDSDFVPPFQPWPTSKADLESVAAVWKKMIEGKTDAGWGYPFSLEYKKYWNPKTFDEIMDGRYGKGSAALWKTGGNSTPGFWEHDESGSLNAVHDLLRGLGVRTYMAGEENEIIPKMASIPLQNINKTNFPDYAMRDWQWYGYGAFSFDDVLWSRRIGMNSTYQITGPSAGAGSHGLIYVYGSDECKKNHPEYFAIFAGERVFEHKGHGSACFSSEGLEKETVKYIRFIFENLNLPSVDIWPGDGLKPCQCEKCQRLTPSEMVWGFANRVATEVYKTHPDRIITCGAYTSYIDAPDTIEKFSPNLAVWIANSGRAKMLDPEHWDQFMKRIQKWHSKISAGHIFRAENNRYHVSGFSETSEGKTVRGRPIEYPVIHPRSVARELKALKGISSGDTGEQSQYGGKWKVPEIEHITLYVQSRFLWDADLDVDEVLNEYCENFYGPAAKQMKTAIDFAEANLAVKDTSRGAGKSDIQNVPLEIALKLRDLLKEAKDIAGDSVYGKRIDTILSSMISKEELIARDKAEKKLIEEARAKAPTAVGVEGSDLSKATEYFLKNSKTGEEPQLKTSFKAGWENNALILEIICKEPNVKNLAPAADVYSGEFVAITIQTQFHKHYILEINPDGLIVEGDPKKGWKSLAEARPERGEDFWRLTLRIPVVGGNEAAADPKHRVAGEKPTPESPWYINVGRQIQKKDDRKQEIQLFSLSPKLGWHDPIYFGKLEIK